MFLTVPLCQFSRNGQYWGTAAARSFYTEEVPAKLMWFFILLEFYCQFKSSVYDKNQVVCVPSVTGFLTSHRRWQNLFDTEQGLRSSSPGLRGCKGSQHSAFCLSQRALIRPMSLLQEQAVVVDTSLSNPNLVSTTWTTKQSSEWNRTTAPKWFGK